MVLDKHYLNCEYIPKNSIDGEIYTWNDFLDVAKGNEKLAMRLIDVCYWQYPETEIHKLIITGEIAEYNDTYIMLYDDDVCKQLWEEFADVLIDYDNPDYPDGIIDNNWFIFEAGTERMEIWRWFDEHCSNGVHALMFPSEH